jgi:3-oxoacyl-[acyl-carrier protein] reductase
MFRKTSDDPAAAPVALVTGGGGGLGAAMCQALADAGYRVVVHYAHDPAAAQAVVQTLESRRQHACAIHADFSRSGAAEGLIADVLERCGRIDVLVNNAAWDPGARPLGATDEQFIDTVLAINVRAPLLLASGASQWWIRAGCGGSIVNVGSIQSAHCVAGHSAYAASKGALDAMTRQLAVELGPYGIRVNGVAPGFIEIPRTVKGRPGYDRERVGRRIPLGRVGFPEDVAGVVAFLCSDAARYVNGEIITIDGGSVRQLPTHDHPRPNRVPTHA